MGERIVICYCNGEMKKMRKMVEHGKEGLGKYLQPDAEMWGCMRCNTAIAIRDNYEPNAPPDDQTSKVCDSEAVEGSQAEPKGEVRKCPNK